MGPPSNAPQTWPTQMNQPDSLALVSAAYPPYSWGGIDTQTYDLAHQLSALGIQVTVFCGGTRKPLVQRENENLEIHRLPVLNVPPRVVWFQLQNLRILSKELAGFDLFHSQHSSGSALGLVKNKIGKPWVVSFHDHQLRRLQTALNMKPWEFSSTDIFYYAFGYPIFELLTDIELKWADHYIVCGKAGHDDYVRFSKMKTEKTTLIPNGIDLEKLSAIVKQNITVDDGDEPTGDFILFTCGRLTATKGIDYLIKAMPFVVSEHQKVKLRIFGKGPMEAHLRKTIESLNLDEHVKLEGYVSYPQLIREMSRCDLAIFPSTVEVGASIALMEAMFCHRAVVAFDYPFTREAIEHPKTGYLVSRRDPKKLAIAICALIEDEGLRKRIGENAFNYILNNHDYKKIIRKYVGVYSRILESRCA